MGDRNRPTADPPVQVEGMNEAIEQVLDSLSPEQRTVIERSMVAQFAMVSQATPESEVAKRITGEHITKMLDNQSKAMELTHKDENNRKLLFAGIIVALLATVFGVIVLLKDQPETMEKILTVLITATISGLGGYGIGRGKDKGDD